MSGRVPQKKEPTSAPEKQIGASYEIPLGKERIEAAFGEAPSSTDADTNASSVGTRTVHRPVHPRGIRLIPPAADNRMIGFVIEQRWHGYVTAIEGDKFHAVVYDTSPEYKDEVEEVEFESQEVAELMRPLIVSGAIFFWDIGFQVEPSGQRLRQSIVSFPMIPVHTKEQLVQARARARARFQDLGWGQTAEHATKQSKEST
jgi:hypothetical protein